MTSQATRIIAVVAVMTLSLFGMIYSQVTVLQSDTEIILKTEPIDPRSLFRGDYVILGYSISQLKAADLDTWQGRYNKGDPVFVTLKKQDGEWQAIALTPTFPNLQSEDEITLRGNVDYIYQPTSDELNDLAGEATIDIHYGIESYFVPEGVGKDLEEHRNEERLSMLIAVGKKGRVAIKGLIIDGELTHKEGLF